MRSWDWSIVICFLLGFVSNHKLVFAHPQQQDATVNTCRSTNDESCPPDMTPPPPNATTTSIPRLTPALVQEILQYKGIYTDNDEYDACQVRTANKNNRFLFVLCRIKCLNLRFRTTFVCYSQSLRISTPPTWQRRHTLRTRIGGT